MLRMLHPRLILNAVRSLKAVLFYIIYYGANCLLFAIPQYLIIKNPVPLLLVRAVIHLGESGDAEFVSCSHYFDQYSILSKAIK
jgi:hypothetical protein